MFLARDYTRQPPLGIGIRRGRGLAKRLEHLYLFNQPAGNVLRDSAAKATLTHGSTANNWTNGPAGFALTFNVNGNDGAISSTNIPTISPPFSILVIVRHGTDGIIYGHDQAASGGYRLSSGAATANALSMTFPGVADYDSGIALTSGRWYVCGVRVDAYGGTARFIVRDLAGGSVKQASVSVGTASGTPNRIQIGSPAYPGLIAYAAHWSRQLSPSEALELVRNPWAVVQPMRVPVYADMSAPAPPAQGGAIIQNLMIG